MIGSIDYLVGRQQRKNENDQLLVIDRILGLIRKSNYLTRKVNTGTEYMETQSAIGTIVIDKEFQSLIPPLASEERQQLEQNIKEDGCRDPLVVWRQEKWNPKGWKRLGTVTKKERPAFSDRSGQRY
jgi:hypothetical protein